MAKTVTRKLLKQFGVSGPTSKFGQFGSQVAGAPINTKDPLTIQNLNAWLNGWQDAVYGTNKAPLMEDMNGLIYVAFWQLFYLLQEGIPEWDSTSIYFIGSLVRKAGLKDIYQSLTDDNTNNALPGGQSDNANWQFGSSMPSNKLVGSIIDSQISGMSASKLIGQVTSSQILSVAAAIITGQVVDSQISGMSSSKLIGLILDAQIQSLSASKITGTFDGSVITAGTIKRDRLSTGTGYLSGGGGATIDVAMNDYSFFPSIETHAGRDAVGSFASTDSGNTVGRFSKGNSQAYDIRWRYITASDQPRMWAVVNEKGDLLHVWESEDPVNQAQVEDGFEEMCPFSQDVCGDGEKIVRLPIMTAAEIKEFFTKIDKSVRAEILGRYHHKMTQKQWLDTAAATELHHAEAIVDALPSAKKEMGAQWFLRAIFGKTNVAKALRHTARYSHNDGRIVLDRKQAEHIESDGLKIT